MQPWFLPSQWRPPALPSRQRPAGTKPGAEPNRASAEWQVWRLAREENAVSCSWPLMAGYRRIGATIRICFDKLNNLCGLYVHTFYIARLDTEDVRPLGVFAPFRIYERTKWHDLETLLSGIQNQFFYQQSPDTRTTQTVRDTGMVSDPQRRRNNRKRQLRLMTIVE